MALFFSPSYVCWYFGPVNDSLTGTKLLRYCKQDPWFRETYLAPQAAPVTGTMKHMDSKNGQEIWQNGCEI